MAKSCDFLKCPAQELSNGIVFVNGTQKFASLDFREVCVRRTKRIFKPGKRLRSFLISHFKTQNKLELPENFFV